MRPAFSVIFFTVVSGAGYGLLALAGALAAAEKLPRTAGTWVFFLGLALTAAGFLSSTFHLGHPERAWRALTQWRTSWLAREGVLAILTFPIVGGFALLWLFGPEMLPAALLAILISLGAAATTLVSLAALMATAMIYASLKTIQRWHNGWVPAGYFAFALLTGGMWLNLIARLTRDGDGLFYLVALAALAATAFVKLGYWRFIDQSRSASTAESATGLGNFGKVRLLDPPHTEENFLLHEMGFRIARKHARKLRSIALLAGFVVPAAALLLAYLLSGQLVEIALATLAVVSAMLGTLVERWLFFAEAKHTVMLYYGQAES